jgi:hypothetical protein
MTDIFCGWFLAANGQQFIHTDIRTSTYLNKVAEFQVKCWVMAVVPEKIEHMAAMIWHRLNP